MKHFRFSLRGLLALALLGAVVSFVHKQRREVHAVVRYIEKLGGSVEYRRGYLDRFHERTNHYFATPVTVRLARSSVAGGDLQTIGKLTSLERLYLERTKIRSDDLKYLLPCRKLQRLSIWGNRNITGKALGYLKQLPDLRLLDIHSTLIDVDRIAECGEFPALEKLVFSPRFMSGDFGLRDQDIQKLLRIPMLEPVGPCYFYRAQATSLNRILRHDFDRVREIHFRECDLDLSAMKRLNRKSMSLYQFQSCAITARELAGMNHRPNRELRFFLRQVDDAEGDLSLSDLCHWLPGGLRSLTVRANEVRATFAGLRPVRIKWIGPRPGRLDLQSIVASGCEYLSLPQSKSYEEDLRQVLTAGYSRSLGVHASPTTWRYLSRMTRLQHLTLIDSGAMPLQFSPEMELQTLTLMGSKQLRPSDWNNIAQLGDLRSLTVQGQRGYSREDLAMLVEMQSLREVCIQGLSAEANALLQSHGISVRRYIGGRM